MKYEDLIKEVDKDKISFYENNKICELKGLYVNKTITINSNLETSAEKTCILAEELGHYHTSSGDILDQSKLCNRKQERLARAWGYKKLVTMTDLVNAYNDGVGSVHELADYLNITEEFVLNAIEYYREKYGLFCELDNYIIYFKPFGVFRKL